MVANPRSFYVARTDEYAEKAFRKSQELGLEIRKDRFRGMTNLGEQGIACFELLVDDLDYILTRHLELGLRLVERADVITITGEK